MDKLKIAALFAAVAALLVIGWKTAVVDNRDFYGFSLPLETADVPSTADTPTEPKNESSRETAQSSSSAVSAVSSSVSSKAASSSVSSAGSKKSESSSVSSASSETKPSIESSQDETSGSRQPYVRITSNYHELEVGETVRLDVEFEPRDKRCAVLSSDPDIITVNYDGTITAVSEGECTITAHFTDESASDEITINVVPEPEPGEFDDVYINGILIVNKTYGITRGCDPGGIDSDAQASFDSLVAAAAEDGYSLYALSGYRSYREQESLYSDYVYLYGQAGADAICSKAGHSEHQTGLAIDVASTATGYFPGSAEAAWLENNCARFGFIIRYPYGKESITGYEYEAWHIRYVGDAARDIMSSGLCLEEYLGVG